MRIQWGFFSLLSTFLIICSYSSFSQSVHFSDSLGPSYGSTYVKIIGSINGKNLVLEGADKKESMQLLVFDSSCRFIVKKPLTFIPFNNLTKIDLFNNAASWDIIWQSFSEGEYRIFFARLNENGDLLGMKQIADSAIANTTDLNGFPFTITPSASHHYYMAHTAKYDSAQSLMRFISYKMDTASLKIISAENDIAFNPAFDQLSKPYLDEEGNTYIARYDNPKNYRLGSTINVFKIALQGNISSFPSLYSKEKKPQDIFFSMYDNKLFAGALYTDFYTHTCDGICCFSYNFSGAQWDSSFYMPFVTPLKKQVHKNILSISRMDLMNLLQLTYFNVKKDKTCSFLLKLECPQYPDRGEGDPNNPRNTNYNADNLPKTNDNPGQKPAPAITGPAARNFWAPNYVLNADPALLNKEAGNSSQNQGYSNNGNIFMRPNPLMQKTTILQVDFGSNNLSYAVIHSQTAEGMNYISPVTSASADTIIHFSYDINSKGAFRMHIIKAGPFVPQKNITVLDNDPRLLLLNENPWISMASHKLIAFFENQMDHCFGLATITW